MHSNESKRCLSWLQSSVSTAWVRGLSILSMVYVLPAATGATDSFVAPYACLLSSALVAIFALTVFKLHVQLNHFRGGIITGALCSLLVFWTFAINFAGALVHLSLSSAFSGMEIDARVGCGVTVAIVIAAICGLSVYRVFASFNSAAPRAGIRATALLCGLSAAAFTVAWKLVSPNVWAWTLLQSMYLWTLFVCLEATARAVERARAERRDVPQLLAQLEAAAAEHRPEHQQEPAEIAPVSSSIEQQLVVR